MYIYILMFIYVYVFTYNYYVLMMVEWATHLSVYFLRPDLAK